MEEIKRIYNIYDINLFNYEILDMDPDDFLRRGHKAAKLLKKLINKYEVRYIIKFIKSMFMFIVQRELVEHHLL